MTEQERAEWQQRLQAAVAETLRRRAQRRQQRQDLNAARAAGLRQRHHQKLHREDQPMTPAEQTAVEFDIRRRERAELDRAIARYCLHPHPELIKAIHAYATACARAAVAVVREVQAEKA